MSPGPDGRLAELWNDLAAVLIRAIDDIDLAVHQSGLTPEQGFGLVRDTFGLRTAEAWSGYNIKHPWEDADA